MTALEKWKSDFKEFISELSMPRDDYKGIMEYIDEVPIEALEQQPCEDCRNCKKWDKCPCGKEGHENGTSIGYSIGECKNYEPFEDAISRQAVDELSKELVHTTRDKADFLCNFWEGLQKLPSVTPKEKLGHCKDCKWWKDSDGAFRRGVGAESKCLINRKEVFEGEGYCYMFKPQESEGKE